MTYSYALTQDLTWQSAINWQQPDTPFMSYAYWQALTDTGAIGQQSGWVPLYVLIYKNPRHNDNGDASNNYQDNLPQNLPKTDTFENLVAAMPLFIKGHHQGEYVFDHAWAEAYARYGADYYPRLVTAVPYTPVSGQRFWLAKGAALTTEIWQAAIAAIDEVAKQTGASSWHGLFMQHQQITAAKPLSLMSPQLLERQGCQFLWHNQKLTAAADDHTDNHTDNNTEDTSAVQGINSFLDFDDFLTTLTAKKRKNIRAERKKIAKQKLTCRIKTGHEIGSDDWDIFYQCYTMTYAVRGRHPYLSAEFFEQIAQSMPEHLMLAQALDEGGDIIASSLFFYDDPKQKNATLYGRYWGCLEEYDSLHFELCYYLGIEFAIDKGLAYFDPGTQGEHKLIRGFVPTKTHSLHRIYDPRFEPAIANFCAEDRHYMQQYRQQAHEALPFNIDNMPAFKG